MRLIGSHIIAIFTPKIPGLEQCQPRADGSNSFYGQRISRKRPGTPYAPEASFSTTQLLQNLQEASKRPTKHLEGPINNHIGIIFKLRGSHVDAMSPPSCARIRAKSPTPKNLHPGSQAHRNARNNSILICFPPTLKILLLFHDCTSAPMLLPLRLQTTASSNIRFW